QGCTTAICRGDSVYLGDSQRVLDVGHGEDNFLEDRDGNLCCCGLPGNRSGVGRACYGLGLSSQLAEIHYLLVENLAIVVRHPNPVNLYLPGTWYRYDSRKPPHDDRSANEYQSDVARCLFEVPLLDDHILAHNQLMPRHLFEFGHNLTY